MAKTIKNWVLMLSALLLILACATPVVTPPPPGFAETAIAETYSVAASQTAQVKIALGVSKSLTPTATKIPSATPFATFTAVSLGSSFITALSNTSCRRGPGDNYDQVFVLRKGRTAELVGRSSRGGYLIIRNPNRPEQLCWVATGTVQVSRVVGNLPAMTPPRPPTPTRTPSRAPRPPNTSTFTRGPTSTITETPSASATPAVQFDLIFSGLDNCSNPPATWWINFEVGNIGNFDFESISITITDNDAAGGPLTLTLVSDQFSSSNGCNPPTPPDDTLLVGFSRLVSSQPLSYDPSLHHIDATITLCTDDALGGICVTKIMNVVP